MRATAGNRQIDATAEVDFASATDLLPYPVEGKRLERALSSIYLRERSYTRHRRRAQKTADYQPVKYTYLQSRKALVHIHKPEPRYIMSTSTHYSRTGGVQPDQDGLFAVEYHRRQP
jgi:hypothetical protein